MSFQGAAFQHDAFQVGAGQQQSLPGKIGGDDKLRNPGWNKKAWQRRRKAEDALDRHIEAAYAEIMGIAPIPQVIAAIKQQAHTAIIEETYQTESYWNQAKAQIEYLGRQVEIARQIIENQREQEDEEAILLLLH